MLPTTEAPRAAKGRAARIKGRPRARQKRGSAAAVVLISVESKSFIVYLLVNSVSCLRLHVDGQFDGGKGLPSRCLKEDQVAGFSGSQTLSIFVKRGILPG